MAKKRRKKGDATDGGTTEERLLDMVERMAVARSAAIEGAPLTLTAVADAVGVSRPTAYRYNSFTTRLEALQERFPSAQSVKELKSQFAAERREYELVIKNLAHQVQALSLDLKELREVRTGGVFPTRIRDIATAPSARQGRREAK